MFNSESNILDALETLMEELLALRGKISIEYDWEQEEATELSAAEERERDSIK